MITNYGELDVVIDRGRAKVAGQGRTRATREAAPQGQDVSGGPKYDSKLEAAFHQHLLARKQLGEFQVVLFHAMTLTLAKETRYTPDFFCVTGAGDMVIYETKGFMREAARVRLNVAAEIFWWFQFVLVTKHKGQWIEKTVR